MKKIMFNDKYGLTNAVLSGKKTMTRRIITYPSKFQDQNIAGYYRYSIVLGCELNVVLYDRDERLIDSCHLFPKYKVGERIAIAQSYSTIAAEMMVGDSDYDLYEKFRQCAMGIDLKGNRNKMFVRADLMPHYIRITNIKLEHLQDISDEDCFKEGIVSSDSTVHRYYPCWDMKNHAVWAGWGRVYDTPRDAFAELIDRISGKGTWEMNPYVWVYEFENLN